MRTSLRFEGACPLNWPKGWERTPAGDRTWARFKSSFDAARVALALELDRLGAVSALLSSNVPLRMDGQPRANAAGRLLDPGVAVHFTMRGDPKVIALACDKWLSVEHNLQAIAKHVEAMRGQERWGVGSIEQAMAGYVALPEPTGLQVRRQWWEVLDLPRGVNFDRVRERYRELSRTRHPDAGGSREEFLELSRARDEAEAELVHPLNRSAS